VRDFVDKALAVTVLQLQHLRERPVKVIGDKGYLLEQAVEGVAYDSPGSEASTWKAWLQFGQFTVIWVLPLLLMVR
jgi:hypothetical protein